MVKINYNIEVYTFPKNHKKDGVRMLSIKCIKKKNISLSFDQPVVSDFKQGKIGNCGVISALAAISQREEFMSEIAPRVEQTNEGFKLHFKMFSKGVATIVTIDDALPFDKNNEVAYARSLKCNIALASYFEKAFVKLACHNSYSICAGTSSDFLFSSFSDCLICYRVWRKEEQKNNIIKYIISELKMKSSVTIGVRRPFDEDPDEAIQSGHSYAVINFNEEKNALKLYEPNCHPPFCVASKSLSSSITENADPKKGEFWVTYDQFENRKVMLYSLHSKERYKSFLKVNKNVELSPLDNYDNYSIFSCKVSLNETSNFTVNFYLYSHELRKLDFIVKDADKHKLKINFEIPNKCWVKQDSRRFNGGELTQYHQLFKLNPGYYEFTFVVGFSKEEFMSNKKASYSVKIGSTAKCYFEEIEDKKDADITELFKKIKV